MLLAGQRVSGLFNVLVGISLVQENLLGFHGMNCPTGIQHHVRS